MHDVTSEAAYGSQIHNSSTVIKYTTFLLYMIILTILTLDNARGGNFMYDALYQLCSIWKS